MTGLAILLLLLGLPAQEKPATEGTLVEGVVAVVENSVITRFDLQLAMTPEVSLMNPALSPAEREEEFQKIQRRTLQNLVDNELVLASARKQGIEISDLELDERLAQMMGADTEKARMEEEAKRIGFESLEHFRAHIRKKMLMDRVVMMQVRSKVKIGDEELDREFAKRYPGDSYRTVKVAHILFSLSDVATLARYHEIMQRAADVLKEIEAGNLTFEQAATTLSDDRASAQDGGLIGAIAEGTMEQSFEAAVFALKPGQVSQPVRSSMGIHILKSLGDEWKTFDSDEKRTEAKLRLRGLMEDDLFEKLFRRWLDSQRRRVRVDIRL